MVNGDGVGWVRAANPHGYWKFAWSQGPHGRPASLSLSSILLTALHLYFHFLKKIGKDHADRATMRTMSIHAGSQPAPCPHGRCFGCGLCRVLLSNIAQSLLVERKADQRAGAAGQFLHLDTNAA